MYIIKAIILVSTVYLYAYFAKIVTCFDSSIKRPGRNACSVVLQIMLVLFLHVSADFLLNQGESRYIKVIKCYYKWH